MRPSVIQDGNCALIAIRLTHYPTRSSKDSASKCPSLRLRRLTSHARKTTHRAKALAKLIEPLTDNGLPGLSRTELPLQPLRLPLIGAVLSRHLKLLSRADEHIGHIELRCRQVLSSIRKKLIGLLHALVHQLQRGQAKVTGREVAPELRTSESTRDCAGGSGPLDGPLNILRDLPFKAGLNVLGGLARPSCGE